MRGPWTLWRRLLCRHVRYVRRQKRRRLRAGPSLGYGAALFTQNVTVKDGTIRVLHDLSKDLGGTCGSVLWTSATAVVQWLEASPDYLRSLIEGARILELGGGLVRGRK